MCTRLQQHIVRFTGALVLVSATACGDGYGSSPSVPLPQATVVTASGDLTAKLAEFRAQLGDPSNGSAKGQQPSGRREINWDGVPATVTNTSTFPLDFFNVNLTRGLILSTLGSGLRVSDNDFSDLNPLYDGDFDDFSPAKTFMAAGSTVTDVTFRVAGDTAQAAVRGFGVVFSDVDVASATYVELFDATGRRIARVAAPVRSDAKGHSLVGVTFAAAIVTRVRITSGQASLGAAKDITDGGTLDLVVMDDFLYGEPTKR